MFYQVKVPLHQRSLLKYLWWKDSDLYKEVKDYEMCSYMSSGASSPSYSNYALKRTAFDNKEKFSNEAANTLINNFYVDNLLKCLANADKAPTLIQMLSRFVQLGNSSSQNLWAIIQML